MDIFNRFNRKNIQDRQVDTLIGLSKGITADGKVDRAEVEFLESWLIQNSHSQNPIIINLLSKISMMLEDGVFDESESSELLNLLHSFSGDKGEICEVAKATTLPLCKPAPSILFSNSTFLFTGTCAFGTRRQCQDVVETLCGVNATNVTKKLNYLIIGTYVTDSWAHESFGRKIEKAMGYRDSGLPIAIVSEEHWTNEAGL
tara:strand:+ start:650 stop:1255 length:606 start_codon:yes stop_codon:yes gene_type:complete